MDDNLQDFRDSINAWGWSINARKRFNEFIDAIKTEQGLTEQIQRIQSTKGILQSDPLCCYFLYHCRSGNDGKVWKPDTGNKAADTDGGEYQ